MSLVKLVFNDQGGWEKSVELGEHNNVVMIGRNPDCGIQTTNASVSRVHAMVTWRDGKLFVQDPPNGRPTNGTKVDGMRLQPGEMLELFVGSELMCGNFSIRVVGDNNAADNVPHMPEQPQGGVMPMSPNPMMYQQAGYNPNNGRGNNNFQQPQGGGRGYQDSRNPMQRQGGQMQPMQMQPQMNGPANQQVQPMMQPVQQQPMMQQPMMQPVQQQPMMQPVQQQPMMQPVQQQPMMQPVQQQPMMQPQQHPSQVDSSRKRSRSYAPVHGSQPAPQNQMSGTSMEEFIRLQDENASLRRQVDELQAGNSSQDDMYRELQEKLEERDQILTDYERRNEYHETVVTGLKDMIDKLKEQLDHQKEQYQECRKDLVASQDEAESLKMELATLKDTLESKGMATSNAETAIADLKVQLTQKNRLVNDLQRELDLAQFSCKEERENVERLKENVDTLNEALEESQRRNRDMKKVVEQHEVMFTELKGNLNDRAREIRQLQDSLRAKGGGDSAALMQELSQVRDQLNRKNGEIELLQKQLKSAEENGLANGADAEKISGLQDKIHDLEEQLRNATQAAGGDAELLDRIHALETEKSDLERRLAETPQDGKADGALLERLRGLYSEMNDVVSQWREDLGMLDSSIDELQRVFVAYVKIDISKIAPQDRARLENVLKDHDPRDIFEDIGNSLDASQNSLGEIKEKLKDLRGALQQ